MKPTFSYILAIFAIFMAVTNGQKPGEIPEEVKCFLKGFFKCRDNIQKLCDGFEGEQRRPVPIPKDRVNGVCPIVGQKMELLDIKDIDFPPCPCVNGNPVNITIDYSLKANDFFTRFQETTVAMCFTCFNRDTGVVLRNSKEGSVSIKCKAGGGIDAENSNCTF